MKVVFQIDKIDTLDINSDTSLCIAKEALLRNFNVWFYTPDNLTYKQNTLYASANKISAITPAEVLYQPRTTISLHDTDVLFIRQNPPFNMNYITYTYLLELLTNTLIVNDPRSIRNFTEKLSTLMFPDIIIDTIVTSDPEEAVSFLEKYKSIVCKPLYEFGGHDIKQYHVDTPDVFHLDFKSLCKKYNTPIILQKFISDISKGDKRIMLVDGKPVGAIKRIPQTGSIKSNLHAGGKATKTSLTKQDLYISEQVGKTLNKHNILFAGIDVIGQYLTEINVTSPTGVIPVNNLCELKGKQKVECIIWDSILRKL